MKQSALFRFTPIFAIFALLPHPAAALTINLNYSYDSAAGGFFSQNAVAKAALEAAATDISMAITSTLGGISSSQYTVTGTNGSTSAVFDWNYTITNPATGAQVILTDTEIAPDTVTIYAGMQPLLGTTLGEGGMAGVGLSISGGSSGNWNEDWEGAVASAEAQSNAIFGRGGGPTSYSIKGDITFDLTTATYSVSTGIGLGNLWFDSDINDSGSANTMAELENYWHFDHTTEVESGKYDFYSVAVHEMIHSLGLGGSESWHSLVDGDNWLGANVIALYGTGENVVSEGNHIAPGVMSYRLGDGTLQEPVMSPYLVSGERKYLTEVDLAFMQDTGWETTAVVPEPDLAALAALGLSTLLLIRRRYR